MRYIFILLFIFSSLNAQKISALYDVDFSIFGKIGEAYVSRFQKDGRYHIYVDAALTGKAASIGQNRREIHESFGIIENGIYLPELYKITRSATQFYNQTFFVFYPKLAKIEEHRLKEKDVEKNIFDVFTLNINTTVKRKKSSSMKTLDYYANNDLQSIFFNVRSLLLTMNLGDEKVVYAAGGSNKKGEILITKPDGVKYKELANLMPTHEDKLITVVINQDIFKSDKGELYISLDEDYLVKEALLKDVLLFGDIHANRKWKKIGSKLAQKAHD
ncbi:MAG: hypothetical protein U9R50_10380 [Campylobacterota bacterium]|nr:hypothetical protein [Campylobacterota bacterium]